MPAMLEDIMTTIREGHLDEAAKLLKNAPKSAVPSEVTFLRGYLAEAQHDLAAAGAAYEAVLANDPKHTEALFRLAYLNDLCGDDEAAVAYYERCVAEPPAHVNALINLSLLYEETSRFAEAEECVERILDEHPEHTRTRLFRKHLTATINMVYDDDASRRTRERDAMLDMPLVEFELSVRSRNCLKQMNLHTLGDLLRISETDLLGYKNFGETSLNEIKALLAQKGLRIGQLIEEKPREAPAAPEGAAPPAPGDPILLKRPVSELELSVRSRRCLQRLGITSIEELIQRSEPELLSIKNFGVTSLNEIKRELAERGMSLRGSKI